MKQFEDMLKGGDLRSIGEANKVMKEVTNQGDFDILFKGLFHSDRKIVMRTADAIEKITLTNQAFLKKHKLEILALSANAQHIELKWHLALLVSRLNLTQKEFQNTWDLLTKWATDKNESKIVRVNSVQGLFNLLQQNQALLDEFNRTLSEIKKENIASLNARIKKLQKH